MTVNWLTGVSPFISTALLVGISWDRAEFPDWFGIFRTVMMGLGGVVVIVIVLVVAIAIVSGVMGMIGNLKKRSK